MLEAVSPLLEANNISKAYPGVQALQNVSLRIMPGELLAVVGENGAGKSTLMKIIAGVEGPNAGAISWNGTPLLLSGVLAAEKLGIVLIHQELNLAHNLDLAASLFLGREQTWGGPLRLLRRDIYPQAEVLLKRVGLSLSPRTLVGNLSVGQQQLVEIARALALQSRLLIMDEPTSSLTETETRTLYDVIATLKSQGVSILYISHRLKEVQYLADRAVVLRDGRNSGELNREEINPDALIKLMVGRELKKHHRSTAATSSLKPVLVARNIRWKASQPKEGISLTVHAGEIVGMAGLVGAGRTELAEVLFGIRPKLDGAITLAGKHFQPRTPRHAINEGIFLVPEDRRHQGLLLADSVRDNISLATLNLRQILGIIKRGEEKQLAKQKVEQLQIRTPSISQTVGLLSGGNQQKAVLAKGLVKIPKVLILDEPTRGVDVGAKAEIYSIMQELANQGVAILMISSDLEEVLGVSDRVIVLHENRWAGELSGSELGEEAVMHLATGRTHTGRIAS
jgi:ribose transport system ATP-binding protein